MTAKDPITLAMALLSDIHSNRPLTTDFQIAYQHLTFLVPSFSGVLYPHGLWHVLNKKKPPFVLEIRLIQLPVLYYQLSL